MKSPHASRAWCAFTARAHAHLLRVEGDLRPHEGRAGRAPSLVWRMAVAMCALAALVAPMVRAEGPEPPTLEAMVARGPMIRADFSANGELDAVVAVADIDAPAQLVWSVLVDYERYGAFMPRVKDIIVSRAPDGRAHVTWKVATPIVTTHNVDEMTADAAAMILRGRTVKGDMLGSSYEWRLVTLGDKRCRMIHTARHRNMASLVDLLDDKQHAFRMSVSMGTAMATVVALKRRAETLAHPAVAPDATQGAPAAHAPEGVGPRSTLVP